MIVFVGQLYVLFKCSTLIDLF